MSFATLSQPGNNGTSSMIAKGTSTSGSSTSATTTFSALTTSSF
ncbi:hypothetical protein [Flavobacterium piscinae]|nr:hypothetical protein [Flavobacterium piscinae]